MNKHETQTAGKLQAQDLLTWYDQSQRTLPWRFRQGEPVSAYKVWLSEIMLQQTRVETVIPYFERFLNALPEPAALAAATEDEVLKLWEGLGYYRRARYLHQAAKVLERDYNGEFPRAAQELRALPGIGDYTSAAIASIAFGEPVPAVDGNVLRIFSRLTGYHGEITAGAAKKAADQFFQKLIDPARPGDFNQALMDLGSLVCLPKGTVRCADCPWQTGCLAYATDQVENLPVRAQKKPRRQERKTVLVIHVADAVLIQERPQRGLLSGLYEFPTLDGHYPQARLQSWLREVGLFPSVASIQVLPRKRHLFSHLEWVMIGYDIALTRPLTLAERSRLSGACVHRMPSTSQISWQEAADIPFPVSRLELAQNYPLPSAISFYKQYYMSLAERR